MRKSQNLELNNELKSKIRKQNFLAPKTKGQLVYILHDCVLLVIQVHSWLIPRPQ